MHLGASSKPVAAEATLTNGHTPDRRSWVRWLAGAACVAVLFLGAIVGWAYASFGSLGVAAAYLQGERFLVGAPPPDAIDAIKESEKGEVKELSITVFNRTPKTVRLIGSHAGCGCGLKDQLPLDIRAGEDQVLTFRVIGGSAWATSGSMVSLYTDSPARPIVPVFIGDSSLPAGACPLE